MARVFSPDPEAGWAADFEAERAATRDLLARLVAHDTTSVKSNRALIDEVAGYLQDRGIEPVLIESDRDGNANRKAGLIASIGPNVEGGIVLSGHTDVVPTTGQPWDTDPFRLEERDGRYYGRGTADMKGFLACALAMVPRFQRAVLSRPIHLAFSWDEEIGCLGAPPLIAALLTHRSRPGVVIVGEPTGMLPADRHRGINTYVTTVTGRGGHSSQPARGVNAIGLAARYIVELDRRARAIAALQPLPDEAAASPEYTTLNVGEISGGSAVNMIAETCRISWECRPGNDDAAGVLAGMDRFVTEQLVTGEAASAGVRIETQRVVSVPPLLPNADSAAVDLVSRLTGCTRCIAAPFASEAGFFQQAGVPAVVCGPGRPSEAHQPNEYIEQSQLDGCLQMLRRLIACGG